MIAVWTWHIPLVHDAVGRWPPAFLLEQLSFLTGGTALWTAIFVGRRGAAALASAIAAFLAFTHMSMFGLVLSLVPTPIYDPRLCGGWGLTPLADQQLGGTLMAAGGLVFLPVAIAAFRQCLDSSRSARLIATPLLSAARRS